jgi:hypothetical protein
MFWSWRRPLYPPYELTVAAGLLFSIYVFFIIPPSNQTHHFTYFHSHSLFILLVSVLLYSTGLGVQQSAGHINHSLQKIDFTPPLSPTHHTFYPCCNKPHQPPCHVYFSCGSFSFIIARYSIIGGLDLVPRYWCLY